MKDHPHRVQTEDDSHHIIRFYCHDRDCELYYLLFLLKKKTTLSSFTGHDNADNAFIYWGTICRCTVLIRSISIHIYRRQPSPLDSIQLPQAGIGASNQLLTSP